MGLFDFLTGNKAPDPAIPRLPRDELYRRLLAIIDPDARFRVRAADGEGRADLVAEWHPAGQTHVGLFAVAGRHAGARILLRLVEDEGVVRSVDQLGEFVWEADPTGFRFEVAGFRGQQRTIGATWTFGAKPAGGVGVVDEWRWDTDDIKRPLRAVVEEAGWGWHGVAFARL